jgi:hypothetical protein
MLQPEWTQNKYLRAIALIGCVLSLVLGLSPAVLAGYTPRNPSRPNIPTGSGGSRGDCPATESSAPIPPSAPTVQPTLTLLAPQNHIGSTGTTHPTLVWFVPDQMPHPVEVTLFQYSEKGRGKRMQTITMQSSTGIMQLSLPKDQPGLSVGQTYVWQVALICNRNRPAKNPWLQAVVEVTALPADLKTQLSTTTDPLQRAKLYAEAGFWYEALAETLKTPKARAFQQTLLETLSKSELPDQKTRLQTVMAIE